MPYSTAVAIVGGRIVDLSTAYQLLQENPNKRMMVLDKEHALAQHQTGCNSGETGIYYSSLKASNFRDGKAAMEAFCAQEVIEYELCGKVIVATEPEELPVLKTICERGQANSIRCEMIGPERLREIEPHPQGLRAMHLLETGIVDDQRVSGRLAELSEERGGEILNNARVERILSVNGTRIHLSGSGSEFSVSRRAFYSND